MTHYVEKDAQVTLCNASVSCNIFVDKNNKTNIEYGIYCKKREHLLVLSVKKKGPNGTRFLYMFLLNGYDCFVISFPSFLQLQHGVRPISTLHYKS